MKRVGTSDKKRIVWLDYARALAILAVILCHSTEAIYSFDVSSVFNRGGVSSVISFFLYTVGRLGVPLFLFLSGYLLLDRSYDESACKKFWKTKWVGLLVATEIWIVVYDVFLAVVNGTPFSWTLLVKNMLFLELVDMDHIWYMPVILGLYLFLPFIANGLKYLENVKLLVFPLCIIGLVLFVVPIMSVILQCLGMSGIVSQIAPGFSGGVYGCYMLLGYCVKKGLFERLSTTALIGSGLACFAGLIAFQLFGYSNGVRAAAWYSNGMLLIAGVCAFVLLSRIKGLKELAAVSVISQYSFALYLVHFPVRIILAPMICTLGLPSHALEVMLLALAVLVVSLAVCVLIARIPKLGPRALYLR